MKDNEYDWIIELERYDCCRCHKLYGMYIHMDNQEFYCETCANELKTLGKAHLTDNGEDTLG